MNGLIELRKGLCKVNRSHDVEHLIKQVDALIDAPAIRWLMPDGSCTADRKYGEGYGGKALILKPSVPASEGPTTSEADKAMWSLQEFYQHDAKALEAIAECREILAAHTAP